MKDALKVTFGAMLAASMVTPTFAAQHRHNHQDFVNNTSVYVMGTWLKPSNNGLSVGDIQSAHGQGSSSGIPFDGSRRAVFLEPENDWNYGLGIAYHVPCSHTAYFITYEHFDADEEQGNLNVRNIDLAPNLNQPTTNTSGWARVEQNWQEFRVGAKHGLHFQRFSLDLLGFFEYDKVRQTLNETNQQRSENQATVYSARETENKMRGWGPGVGAFGKAYFPCRNWSFFAGATTTLLVADNDYTQYWNRSDQEGGIGGYYYNPEESDSVVAKLDVKFGIDYTAKCSHDFRGMVYGLSLGMKYMNMFNAFKNGNTAFNPPFPEDEQWAANTGFPQDFGTWGPFLKFRIGGSNG